MDVLTAWWYLAAFTLLIEAYRDWMTMKIDERHIYLLFGYTLFLGIHQGTNIVEVFGFMIAAGIVLLTSRSVLARGDQLVLFTLLFGHYKAGTVVWFVLTLAAMIISYAVGKRIKKVSGKAPALPLITAAHLLTLPLLF